MIRLENIQIRKDISEKEILKIACKQNKINIEEIKQYYIYKKSIDARDKSDIYYNYAIDVLLQDENKKIYAKFKKVNEKKTSLKIDNIKLLSSARPVIVGFGPAGMFAALTFIRNGIKPIIIEQGSKVEERKQKVDNFLKYGELNTLSNVQFGEGGAGTFSDGKLTTGTHNPLCKNVLQEFVKYGAPEQIEYINKPHIGTDKLVNIIANIRNDIIKNGGEFLFDTKVTDLGIINNKVNYVICEKNNEKKQIDTNQVILAIGHSARDTFEMLYKNNVKMEKKNFSIGVRIEHKQSMINKSQYGNTTKLKLPPAEYKLAYHGQERSCYTFCMCPGGVVMASSSENGTIVTNGMSKFARDGENANSAVLVNVTPEDFKGDSPLEGIYFQKRLEEKAFILGGSNFYAPIQRVEDFMQNKKSTFIGEIIPTYKPGYTLSNLQEILPAFVINTLKEGLNYFDKKISGFANKDAILTGVETRSSSPVKIPRNEEFMCNIEGIYPCGEGAGYAGGIMSAAVDGIKCATSILSKPSK